VLVKRLNIQKRRKDIIERKTLQIIQIQKAIKKGITTVALLVVDLCEIFNIMS
jgi:hypothetical protein